MNLSKNEFVSLCKRSLRGKGHHWGVCEDLSNALLALAINKFPAPNILLEALNTKNSEINQVLIIPDSRLYEVSDKVDGEFYDPLIILGLISVDRDFKKTPLEITLDNEVFKLKGDLIFGNRSYFKKKVTEISFRKIVNINDKKQNLVTRIQIDKTTFKAIEAWSNLVYAPATEESRQLGAGSEQTDND